MNDRKLAYVKGQVDFSSVETDVVSDLLETSRMIVQDGVAGIQRSIVLRVQRHVMAELVTSDHEPFLPIEWDSTDGVGGDPVNDPSLVYVPIPLGKDEDEPLYFSFSLRSLVDDLIELNEQDCRITDPVSIERCRAVRNLFLEFAEQIDCAIKDGGSE